MRFQGKVVLVTGSSRSIGRATALAFGKEGASVVINYLTNKDEANTVKAEIEQNGGKAITIGADVSKEKQVETMINETIAQFNRIDILVNNAGFYKDSTVWKMSDEIWEEVLKVNLYGTFYCTKHAIKHMRDQSWGRVINISSVVGQTGVFGTANYSAAKAGLFGFTKAVSKEVATKGITVNVLTLGYFDTGMLKRLSPEVQAIILKQIPMGRWGKLNEITQPILFLASEDAAYITGQVIHINGGYYM